MPAIPLIFFTHDNYLKDYTKQTGTKQPYYNKKVVLMVRDPADVAVSQYHQWKYRMADRKKTINDYPPAGADVSLYDFVMMPSCGLPKIIDWMNGWASELDKFRDLLVVRYEDLRADPKAMLQRVLTFIGTPATEQELQEAVEFAWSTTCGRWSRKRVFWLSGRRMLAKDRSNPNTYKVRRAKVGGYRDDFTPEQLAAIDGMIAGRLLPGFGYGRSADGVAEGKRAAG